MFKIGKIYLTISIIWRIALEHQMWWFAWIPDASITRGSVWPARLEESLVNFIFFLIFF